AKTAPSRPSAQGKASETKASETPSDPATEEPIFESFAAVEQREPSEIEKELHAVEEQFLALPGGLDDASRRALWPHLAELNAHLMKWEDAGVCWLHALWDNSDETGKWTAAWFRTEAQAASRNRANGEAQGAEDLDRLLTLPEPATADLRALAAYLAWSVRREPRPPGLVQRLPAIQRFLEKHEK